MNSSVLTVIWMLEHCTLLISDKIHTCVPIIPYIWQSHKVFICYQLWWIQLYIKCERLPKVDTQQRPTGNWTLDLSIAYIPRPRQWGSNGLAGWAKSRGPDCRAPCPSRVPSYVTGQQGYRRRIKAKYVHNLLISKAMLPVPSVKDTRCSAIADRPRCRVR